MRILTTLAVISTLGISSVLADVTETEEFTYSIDDAGRISLENINGDISVIGGSGNEVHITAYKKAENQEYLDKIEIDISAESDHIRIETRHPEKEGFSWSWGDSHGGSVRYELSVPANVELDTIETVNGGVDISGVSGAVKAETVNGDLQVSGLTANVNLDTVNGTIKAEFDQLSSGQKVSAEAVNGKIVIRLPADASAKVNAETINGSIDADDFGLKPEKGFVGRDLDGVIGDGGARLSLDTVNGSIRIVKK
jgi:DUF4097 and DUF4098 domain-containing protein YvlB